MSFRKVFFILAILTVSMAMPRIKKRSDHCSTLTLRLMSTLGAEPKALKCGVPRQQVRGLSDLPGQFRMAKRGSCCGPECDYFIQIMDIDPASVICPTEE